MEKTLDSYIKEISSDIYNKKIKIELQNLLTEMNTNIQRIKDDLQIEKQTIISYKSSLPTYQKKNTQDLIKRAYELIFSFREFLTGQHIDYRYYFTDSDNKVKVFEFKDFDLFNYVVYTENQFNISEKKIREEAKKIEKLDIYQKALNKHFENLKNNIISTSEGKNKPIPNIKLNKGKWLVRSAIIKKYGGPYKLPNLVRLSEPNQYGDYEKTNTWKFHRKQFNFGHLYEAFDITVSKLTKQKKSLSNYENIEKDIVKNTLKTDNVKATSGGDSFNFQIKSNSARILYYSTIINTLTQIQSLLKVKNSQEGEYIIEKYFMPKRTEFKSVIEQSARSIAQKLFYFTKNQ